MPTPANALNITSSGIVKFDGTATFAADSVTQYDVLVGSTSNSFTSVGPGTAGQLFISGGAAADPAYVTPTAGTALTVTTNASTLSYANTGGLILLQTQTASNSASLTFTTGISATYNNYLLIGNNISNSVGSGLLLVQLSSNAGVSYISTGYTSGSNTFTPNSGATFSNTTSTAGLIVIVASNTNAASFTAYLTNMTSANLPCSFSNGIANPKAASLPPYYQNVGAYNTAITVNALQIIFDANNINTGTFSLYGILE